MKPAALGVLLLCSSFCAVLMMADPPSDAVREILLAVRQERQLPALAAAVVRDGQLLCADAVGVRKHDGLDAVTAQDKFHIGSCTKSMTATIAAMLVEQGRLTWQTTIGEVFPDLTETMHPQYRAVTLEQLLMHRGGTPDTLDANDLWGRLWRHKGTPGEQRLFLLRELTLLPPAAPPGTRTIYSNAGYAIAGAMLERVTSTAWEELMRTMLFVPLGMTSAGFGAPAVDSPAQPWGHLERAGKIVAVPPQPNGDNPPFLGPAGTVHCSITDFARYAAFHLRGARGSNRLLLTADSFRKLRTPAAGQDYALGWAVARRDWAGGDALTHAGSNTMFYAVIWLAPQKNFAVVVATNLGGERAAEATDQAAWRLIQKFLLAK